MEFFTNSIFRYVKKGEFDLEIQDGITINFEYYKEQLNILGHTYFEEDTEEETYKQIEQTMYEGDNYNYLREIYEELQNYKKKKYIKITDGQYLIINLK
ncbi:MAG: hypothetical protein Q8J85_07155 [Sulfuricurvum sp.]|nr:hypothetical protein [Sulfuricurvum sp.]MDP3022996.1 hypothetical protein [Sulfuricurvum sp.]